jgi:hypothetical protein
MGKFLLFVVGLVVGLGLVAAVVWLAIGWEARSRAKKRFWLASPSGKIDVPPDGM